MSEDRVNHIMRRMGFDPADGHPDIVAWRAVVAKKVSEGMMNHSYGTWTGDFPPAVRARAMLEVHWAIERGYSARIEALDGLDPKDPMPWVRDTLRRGRIKLRQLSDKARGIHNPYAESQEG